MSRIAAKAAVKYVKDLKDLGKDQHEYVGGIGANYHMKLDDENWHCFTLSRYDRHSGKWDMEKAPVYHIID